MHSITIRLPTFLWTLWATARVIYCRIRCRHQLREWPWIQVTTTGQRMRPYRRCPNCKTISLVEQGRSLLEQSCTNEVLAKDPIISQLRSRPFFGG